ncbi:TPA: 23S rRNA (adenine(2503)-C(2))-methyltransferase RlmN [Candidatus Gracilibacteria bacterium]|nr:23S rRNA (adenine(2503)-C(2))-methyltransferase RlmN [Candidatus Peregrinibacteria bacterium]HIQ56418.1 23S rRNA (adenine(2503)-C(2))-methyltransferase RlmN [Candidatus Gracilibacteria bacterium]HIQ57807.1 23S rRNA (adenine(2503)-C(2))-methyltransferase RlmN [Candidatus Gracilibacteria bacterium]
MFSKFLEEAGQKNFRISQVNHAIFRDLVTNFSEITTLSEDLRADLEEKQKFSVLEKTKHVRSKDTEKILFKTDDGKFIESVLMRHKGRKTACISCQIGCPAGCVFCATGKMGIIRNLTAREIYEQVLYWNRILKEEYLEENPEAKWNGKNPPHEARVRNIVFMGMGEPMFNYENVISAIKFLNDDKKFGIGVRHITLSTVGIVPGIEKLLEEGLLVNLAFSLHAATNKLRDELVPMNKTYNLDVLMPILDKYTKKTGRRIFYEYVVLKGKNDRREDAHDLGKLLQHRMAHLNFIPYNVNPECGDDLITPDEPEMRIMQNILLNEYDVPSTIRMTMGDDVDAACGQLANKADRPGNKGKIVSIVEGNFEPACDI